MAKTNQSTKEHLRLEENYANKKKWLKWGRRWTGRD